MGIVLALVIGVIVGAIAKLLMPGRDPGGLVATAFLGVGGSLLAYALGWAMGWYRSDDSGPGVIASVIGAMLVLALYRGARGRR